MKKLSKLCALVTALSIIASLAVMPISAGAAENLLVNPGFEEEGDIVGATAAWKKANSATVSKSTAEKNSGEYSAYVTHPDGTRVTTSLYQTYTFEPEKYYYIGVYMKPEEPQTYISATHSLASKYPHIVAAGTTETDRIAYNKALLEAFEADLAEMDAAEAEALRASVTRDVNAIIRTSGTYGQHGFKQVSMNTDEWALVHTILNTNNITESKSYSIYVQTNGDNLYNTYNHYLDDFMVSEIYLNETQNVPVNGTITLEGPQGLGLGISSIALESGTVTDVTYNTENENWEITYNGMTPQSTNTVTVTTAVSTSAVAKPTFTITTGEPMADNDDNEETGGETGNEPEQPTAPNLFDGKIDYSFENSATGAYRGTIGETNQTSNETYTIIEAADAYHGGKMLKIVGATDSVSTMQRFNFVSGIMELDAEFEVGVWVKSAGGTKEQKPVSVYVAPYGQSKLQPSVISSTAVKVTPTDEWQRASVRFKTIIRSESNTKDGFHVGISREAACDADIYVDHYEIKRIYPEFKLDAKFENDGSEVGLNTDVELKFSNEPKSFGVENITLKKGSEIITSGIELAKIDDFSYKLSLKNLQIASDYTLVVDGVYDNYDQELGEAVYNFGTTSVLNLLEAAGVDCSFEKGTKPGYIEGTGTMEVIKASDVGIKATHGEKILKISGRTAGSRHRINNVGGGTENCVEAGKQYLVSFDIRLAHDENGNLTTDKAGVFVSNAFPATNTVKPANTSVAVKTDVSSGAWTHMEFIVNMIENPYTGTPANSGFHIGATVAGTSTVYIDNYVLKEYFPPFEVTTTPEDGKTISGGVVTYKFTNAPTSFGIENVEVEGGASVSSVNKISDTEYAVSLENIDYSTSYTIKINNVKDGYGQIIDNVITVTTGSGNAAFDSNIMNNDSYDYSFEKQYQPGKIFGLAYTGAKETFTVVSGEDENVTPYHGNQMLRVDAPEALDGVKWSHRVNGIKGVEIGKRYIIGCYARTVNPNESVKASIMGTSAYPGTNTIAVQSTSSPTVNLTGEWQFVSSEMEVVANTAATQAQTDGGFHILFGADGVDLYIDSYQIFEIPEQELSISSSIPANGADDVEIGTGKIVLNWSLGFMNGFDAAEDAEVKLYCGSTDVSQLITEVRNGFGNSSVEISVDELENNSLYTLSIAGVTDYLGRRATKEISFKTLKTVTPSEFVLADENGNSLEDATGSELKLAKIEIANTGNSDADIPVFIYTVYNPQTNKLEKIGSTAFDGILATGNTATLTNQIEDAENKRVAFYLVNSAENLTLAADVLEKDFSANDSSFENGGVKSDKTVYDINADGDEITISGKGEPNSKMLVVLLGKADASLPSKTFYTETKSALSEILAGGAVDETTIDDYALHFASIATDEEGYYSIVLPVEKDNSADGRYLALTSGGSFASTAEAIEIYIPSDATVASAKAAVNSASDSTELVAAIDRYDYVFGLDTANDVYSKLSKEIAAAVSVMNGSGAYADNKFTDTSDANTFKSHYIKALEYYTRQTEALAEINSATVDSLKTVLEEYSDVLGMYGGVKLDYAAAYAKYGHQNVNRLIVGVGYDTMEDFIKAFNNAVATVSVPSAPTTSGGGGGGSSSGSGGGGSMYVPTTKLPADENAGKPLFSDLGGVEWAEASILELAEMGVINGMGDGTFNPNGNVTREQLLKMLFTLFEINPEGAEVPFADVDASQWYAPYVCAAYETGIVTGISETEFGVGQSITRQDLVTMVSRVCKACGLEIERTKKVTFTDMNLVSEYATSAVQELAGAGIISGVSDGVFAPLENTTRAQAAVILSRLYNL